MFASSEKPRKIEFLAGVWRNWTELVKYQLKNTNKRLCAVFVRFFDCPGCWVAENVFYEFVAGSGILLCARRMSPTSDSVRTTEYDKVVDKLLIVCSFILTFDKQPSVRGPELSEPDSPMFTQSNYLERLMVPTKSSDKRGK